MTWGKRLKEKGRALGLSDADVARGLGITQGRYSTYCNESRQPDLLLFVRICAFLGTTPDEILGVTKVEPGRKRLVARVEGSLRKLDDNALELVAAALEAVTTAHARQVREHRTADPAPNKAEPE